MTEKYVIKDVTRDLAFLLTLTKLFEMDSEGYWYDPGLGKRYVHQLDADDEGKEIIVFKDPLPDGDFYFFNPYSEGFGKQSPAVKFYFKAIRAAFNLNLEKAVLHVIEQAFDHKEAIKTNPDHNLSHIVIRMCSVPIDKKNVLFDVIDETLIEEIKTIFLRMDNDCLFVPYMTAQMTSIVKVDTLTDPKWDEKFGKDIRKKTLLAFKAVIMGVLGIKNPDELDSFSVKYDPELKTSARLYTTLSVYMKLYSKFNDILAAAFAVDGVPSERDVIDLSELNAVIERSGFAYAIAKHMVQPIGPTKHATDLSTSDTSQLRFGDRSGNNPNKSGSRFAPEVVSTGPGYSGGMSFTPQTQTRSRFAAPSVNETYDPFSPVVRSNSFSSQGNFNGGGFGGNSGFSSGFDARPPSNFGTPMTRGFGNR